MKRQSNHPDAIIKNLNSEFIIVLSSKLTAVSAQMVKRLFGVWIKIDKDLPWIELPGTYETRKDARRTAQTFLNSIQLKIVPMPEKKRKMKALITVQACKR
jgi:hypothetical protein